MYIKESGLTQAIDVINQGNKFIAERAGFADQVMREKAKSDLFYAEAEFNKNTQEFLRGLSQRNDYENFEKDLDDYLTQQNAALQKRAHNHYSGELFNQMITSQRNALQNTVQNQILAMSIKDIATQNQSTVNLNREILKGQDGINANFEVFNNEYAKGMRDVAYTKAALLDDATKNIEKDFLSTASNEMDRIFNQGGNFSDVSALIDKMEVESDYKVRMLAAGYASEEGLEKAMETGEGLLDISGEVDKKGIASDIKKRLKTAWDAKIKEVQEKNFNTCTEWYDKMYTLPETDRASFANYCLSKIDTDFSGNNLSASQRAQAVGFFKSFRDGNGTSGAAGTRNIKTLITTNPKTFINLVEKGVLTPYDAKREYEAAVLDEYRNITGNPNADTFDLNKDFPEVYNFLDILKKEAPKQITARVKDLENITIQIMKDNDIPQSEEVIEGVANTLWDAILGLKYTDQKSLDAVCEEFIKNTNGLYGKELDLIRMNPKTGKLNIEEGVTGTDGTLAKFLYGMEENRHFVYTDENNNVQFSPYAGGTEAMNRGETLQREFLKKNLGIETDNLKMSFESDGVDDVKSVQIFQAPDGMKYKVRSPDGKNLYIYTSKDGRKWEQVNTVKQEKAEEKREEKNEARERFIDREKSLDENSNNIAEYLINNPSIKIPGINKSAGSGKTKAKTSLVIEIKHTLQKYLNDDLNPKKKAEFEKWLKENGFSDFLQTK